MKETVLYVFFALVFGLGLFFLEAFIGILLFNWVMGLFGLTFFFTYWQVFGIILLLNFIFRFFKKIL